MMNCGSCIHNDNCEYSSFRKSVESDLYHGDMTEIFKIVCSKYTKRKHDSNEPVNSPSSEM